MKQLSEIQQALQAASLDGWLLYDFRGINPIAARLAGLPPEGHFSRRWAYWIPAHGQPAWLLHRIEMGPFQNRPERLVSYVSWQELRQALRALLGDARRIAMEYSPENAIPYVSRVDAGTVELLRSLGYEVVSSADLVQLVEARWTPAQLAQHRETAHQLNQIKDECFAWLSRQLHAGRTPGEVEAQQFVMDRFAALDLVTDHPPIVGVNQHAADPHYAPTVERQFVVKPGDFVLLDLWAKPNQADGVFADITWTAVAAAQPTPYQQEIFDIVARARDTAVQFIQQRIAAGETIRGCEVDDACRGVITAAGYGPQFIHRTGHSIDTSTHGNGVNMDNLETEDRRHLIPGIAFSIEPGIYLAEFGVRSEINIYVGEGFAEVTTQPVQRAIVPLL